MPAPANYIKVKTKIVGGEELIAELKAVGLNVQGTTRKAVRAGAKVIQAQAEANAHEITRRGGKSIRIQVSSKAKGLVNAKIGPSKRRWYLRFAETGTAGGERTAKSGAFSFIGDDGRRVIVKQIHHPGTAARPFLRPAFDATMRQAEQAVGEFFKQAIEEKKALLDNGPEEE